MSAGGKIASSCFTALCLAGIVTFFSQEGIAPDPSGSEGRATALDPSGEKSKDWSDVVPAAFEDGARIHAAGAASETPRPGTRLKLR